MDPLPNIFCLFVAANRHKECAIILHDAGADPNFVAKTDKDTEEECGKLLERAGADPLIISNFGISACMYNRDFGYVLNCTVSETSLFFL